MEGGSCQPYDWLGQEEASEPHGTEAGQADAGRALPLQVAGGDEGMGPPDPAQVDHCTVISHLHRLSDAGLAAFQHLELVHGVFHTQGQHFVPWKPLPGALVVKEEDKEELLSSLGLFLLSQLQHIQRGNRDGDTIVQEALPGHLGIDDQGRVGGIASALGPHQLQGLQVSAVFKGHQEASA